VLLELREQTQSKGIELKLMNITKLVSVVLEITRLNSVFEITSPAEILSSVDLDRPESVIELAPCA